MNKDTVSADGAPARTTRKCKCGASFFVFTKFKSSAKFCDTCRRKRSDFGRVDGFGQSHGGPRRKP